MNTTRSRYFCVCFPLVGLLFCSSVLSAADYQWRNRPYSQIGSSDLEPVLIDMPAENWVRVEPGDFRLLSEAPEPAALKAKPGHRKSPRKPGWSYAEISFGNDVDVRVQKAPPIVPRFVSENDLIQDPSYSYGHEEVAADEKYESEASDQCIVLDLAATLPSKRISRGYGAPKTRRSNAISKAFPYWWKYLQSGGQPESDSYRRSRRAPCTRSPASGGLDLTCNSQSKLRYRTYDGTCNNLLYPQWGSVDSSYSRLTRVRYDDGFSRPRQFSTQSSYGGRPYALPNVRVISRSMSQSIPVPHRVANVLLPYFGQTIAHDLAFTASHKVDQRNADCCVQNAFCSEPECFQFSIPRNDPLYAFFNLTCHQFARSVPSRDSECASPDTVVREQSSKVTHWLDASFLYASTDAQNSVVRNFYAGQLAFRHVGKDIHNLQDTEIHTQILPSASNLQSSACPHASRTTRGRDCFNAGDERVNQQPLAATVHTIFLRFHNLIARTISQTAPYWSDEMVFQETRKIVIAVYQIVVYKEFLPALWGSSVSGSSLYGSTGLQLLDIGHYQGYDAGLDPHVLNEFAAAGFRLHTLVDDNVPRLLLVTGLAENTPLSTQYNNQTLLYEEGNADALISGMLEEMALAFDPQISEELQGRLFRGQGQDPIGLDLMAISIQRGRDHGLGTYNDVRAACGYGRADGFDGLRDFMPPHHVHLLRLLYRDVDDIDLMVGGLMEDPLSEDASVGPTFACIIAAEFRLKRSADRFWHENPDQFSVAQLRYLRRITMSHLLCQTTGLRYVPSNAFFIVSESNSLAPCLMINDFDVDFYLSLPGLPNPT